MVTFRSESTRSYSTTFVTILILIRNNFPLTSESHYFLNLHFLFYRASYYLQNTFEVYNVKVVRMPSQLYYTFFNLV